MTTEQFDVFLSHNRQDKPAVRELYQELRQKGIKAWLDEKELVPGEPWQPALEQGIKDSAAFAVLVGSDGLGPWQNEEMQAMLNRAVKLKLRVIPVLLPTAPGEPELSLFLENHTWVDLRPALNSDNLERLIWGITGKKPEPESVPSTPPSTPATDNPFLFNCPATGDRFVGREALCRRFIADIEQGMSISLVGDARIGKSSLLVRWSELARQAGRVVRLIDGQDQAGASCSALVAAMIGHRIQGENPDQAADAIADWIQAVSPDQAPVVLVDEAEQCLRVLPARFFERLRGLVNKQRLCLILSTRRDIGEIETQDHQTSPLSNCMKRVQLGLLEENAAQALGGRGAGVLSADDLRLMHHWAGRHAFYLSVLGHLLWQARQEREGSDAALREFRSNAFQRLEEWWKALPSKLQNQLATVLNSRTPNPESRLNDRGFLDQGQPFGEVVRRWWEDRK
jgi:hypothetical protein